jgi:hypothetical protein
MTDITIDEELTNSNTMYITNIKWHKIQNHVFGFNKDIKFNTLPDQMVLEIPQNIQNTNVSEDKLKDIIESFVYNTLTKKYGYEVNNCQIWLPF